MKLFAATVLILGGLFISPEDRVAMHPKVLEGELTSEELPFVGKWRGARANLKWEIDRRDDRSFEMVLTEDYEGDIYETYYIGAWWVEDGDYYYDDVYCWDDWEEWADDYEGVSELITSVSANRIVTETSEFDTMDDDEDLTNVESRVNSFTLEGWRLKP